MALTSHIEAGVTAAYDTGGRDVLMLKFMRAVPCCLPTVEIIEQCYQIVSFKFLMVSRVADGEDLIMGFLREVFWHRYCSTYTCLTFHIVETISVCK
jgi:hypothetical protein